MPGHDLLFCNFLTCIKFSKSQGDKQIVKFIYSSWFARKATRYKRAGARVVLSATRYKRAEAILYMSAAAINKITFNMNNSQWTIHNGQFYL